MLTVMTVCGALLAGAKVFIPNENMVFCPERTLTQVHMYIRSNYSNTKEHFLPGYRSHPLLSSAMERQGALIQSYV